MVNFKAIDKDILGEAYTSNETSINLSNLCSFGSRFSGTPGEKQAIDYMHKKMIDYSLDNPRLEEIEYLGWTRGTTTLEVLEPEYKELDCIGRAVIKQAALKNLKNIIIVHGRGDLIAPVEQAVELAGNLPQGRLIVFENAGHLPFLQKDFKKRLYEH